jgi:hypothetical protein
LVIIDTKVPEPLKLAVTTLVSPVHGSDHEEVTVCEKITPLKSRAIKNNIFFIL